MNAEIKRRALELFDELVDLPAGEQAARIDVLCAGDRLLHAQLVALLRADARDDEPFTGDAARWGKALSDPVATSENPAIGRVIGAWRIVATLGHGGMGTVYAVERNDGAYQQRAALKLIRGAADSPIIRQRFLRERQALARLKHPNIATLIDGGFTAEGDPWFVMEYVDGVTIDRWCDERKLDPRGRVELFLQALAAVQFAHRSLIVHRDLKPSNLLVDSHGCVKLLDFGIAKELENLQATVTSDRALTFAFASPEQLRHDPITTATDLWQLGIVLHQLLSGAHPFGIDATMSLPQQLRLLEREPETLPNAALRVPEERARELGCPTAAALAAHVRGDLAHIVQGCLRRDPASRYASVEALSDDLRSWLEQRPLRIAPPGRWAAARLWLRRNRLLATATSSVAAAVIVGAGVSLWQARIASEQARIAQNESARARAAMSFLTEAFAAAAPERALDTSVSVKHLLDNAREALQRPGAVDPAVRQPVQRMLGRLYASLNDTTHAIALLGAGIPDEPPRSREEALALADDLVIHSELLARTENYPAALGAADRAVELRQSYAPDDPEQQLRMLAHQTVAHLMRSGAEACEAQARRALELAARMPHPPPDVVIEVYNDLAALADLRGSGKDTLALSDEGLAFADRHGVAPESPHRAPLLRFKVQALIELGRSAEAESIVRASIAAVEKTGGSGETRLAVLHSALAQTLQRQGRYREALESMQHVQKLESNDAPGPRDKATLLINLAYLNMQLGDYGQAAQLGERGIAEMERAGIPGDDPYRMDNERAYAQILAATGKFAQARDLLTSLRARSLRAEVGQWQKHLRMALWTAPVLQRLGDARGADDALAEARALLAANDAASIEGVAAMLPRIEGGIARQRGDLAAAARSYREALPSLNRGANRTDAAIAQSELAEVLAAQGDHAGARAFLAQALPILRNAVLPQESQRAAAEALDQRLRGMPRE